MAKIEVVDIPIVEKNIRNIHGVPKKQWAKWTAAGKAAFNALYAQMKDQSIMTHPKMPKMPPNQWKTIRWNASWLAADHASGR